MHQNNDMYFERRITTLEMKFENIDKKLDSIIAGQSNFVTKQDFQLELAKIDHKIDKSINKMVWKLGSIIIGWMTIYPFILQYFGHR